MSTQNRGRKTKAQKDAVLRLDKEGWGETQPIPGDEAVQSIEAGSDDESFAWEATDAAIFDGLIIDQFMRLNDEWQQCDFAGLADSAKATLQRLVWAGLVEQRVALTVNVNARPETINFILCGDFNSALEKRLGDKFPKWKECSLPEFREFRLTPDGSQAKSDLLSGDRFRESEALLWVRRISPAVGPRKVAGTAQIVVATGADFVPNAFQRSILKALEGRALKKQQLADEVAGGDGRRFYRPGGLKELREKGLVEHKHGLGYYRPGAAPK